MATKTIEETPAGLERRILNLVGLQLAIRELEIELKWCRQMQEQTEAHLKLIQQAAKTVDEIQKWVIGGK